MNFGSTSLVFDLVEDVLETVDTHIEEAQVKTWIPSYLGSEMSLIFENNLTSMAIDYAFRGALF